MSYSINEKRDRTRKSNYLLNQNLKITLKINCRAIVHCTYIQKFEVLQSGTLKMLYIIFYEIIYVEITDRNNSA